MATIADARSVQDCLNELVKSTILEVEKLLLRLPQPGDRVDKVTAAEWENNVNEISLTVNQKKPSESVDQSSSSGYLLSSSNATESLPHSNASESVPSSKASFPEQRHTPAADVEGKQVAKGRTEKATARIQADSVVVTPMNGVDGMTIDMRMQLHLASGETRPVDITVECPNFKPYRLNIGGSWYRVENGTPQ